MISVRIRDVTHLCLTSDSYTGLYTVFSLRRQSETPLAVLSPLEGLQHPKANKRRTKRQISCFIPVCIAAYAVECEVYMSAVFEIELLLKEQLTISEVLNFIRKEKLDCDINSIQIQDDWEFSNQKRVPVEQIVICDDLVKQGKIVMIRGVLKSLYRFGFHFWKPVETVFSANFWISTKGIEVLDNDYITRGASETCSFITNKITELLSEASLLIGAIGPELLVPCESELEDYRTEQISQNHRCPTTACRHHDLRVPTGYSCLPCFSAIP